MYSALLSFLLGWQTVFTGSVHNFQRLWLHIYIASNYLPSNFKVALEGLKVIQNLSFFSQTIQDKITNSLTPSDLFLASPTTYIQFYSDVSFANNIYHVLIFAVFICLIYSLLISIINTTLWMKRSKAWLLRHYRYLTLRPYWMFDSLFYFQFVTTSYAILAQFLDTSVNFKPSSQLNIAAASLALIFCIVWPVAQLIYLQVRRFDQNFEYNYR